MFYYDIAENKAFSAEPDDNGSWYHAKYLSTDGFILGENKIPSHFLDNCKCYETFAELKVNHPHLVGAMATPIAKPNYIETELAWHEQQQKTEDRKHSESIKRFNALRQL